MQILLEPSATRGMIRVDAEGNQWEWVSVGKYVTAKHVTSFPWRNDLHRLMSQPASFFKVQ